MHLCLIIAIDCERSTLLVTVNTFCACVYFAAVVGKLSYLVIVLMGHMCSILTKGSTCRKNKKLRFFLILIEQVMTNLLKIFLAF